MLETTAPVLPSRDFDETVLFYESIGFRETGRWAENAYLIMVMDQVELHFFSHDEVDPSTNHAAAYIRSSDVDALSAKVAALPLATSEIPRFRPAEDKSWGMREMAIVDPNGTLLRIGQFL